MAINLHIWAQICILINIAYHLSLKTDPILFTEVHWTDKDISVVHFVRFILFIEGAFQGHHGCLIYFISFWKII